MKYLGKSSSARHCSTPPVRDGNPFSVVVVSASPRARITAKLSPATRETKMYFLYFRNHWEHGEEEDGLPWEIKETVDSNLWYLAPLNIIEVEVSAPELSIYPTFTVNTVKLSTYEKQIKTDLLYCQIVSADAVVSIT